MVVFTVLLGLLLVITDVLSFPEFPEDDIPNVEPEYLDMLLETEQYELFSKLMGIENVELVRPRERARNGAENPMYHKQLRHMDILPARKNKISNNETERQVVDFDVQSSLKWPNGYVPYRISSHYTSKERKIILSAIDNWNARIKCIKFQPRTSERNYVYYFSGDGCYSHMGRTGGQQPISMDVDGCLSQGTIDHEMEHAVGIDHEMSRLDRDNYVKMLWENILDDWKDQFEKIDPDTMKDLLDYDYYSLMHYDIASPDNEDYPAFEILEKGIDESIVGKADDFTEMDVKKINALYC